MRTLLFFMRLIGMLSYPNVLRLGKWIGLLMLRLAKSRRDIAARNLKLCFPELDEKKHKELLRKNFISTGQGLTETAWIWNNDGEKLKQVSQVHGLENLIKAKESGTGVLLLCFHLTSLEMGGNCLSQYISMAAMYRQNRNPDFEKAMTEGRERHVSYMIEREDVRSMLKALKSGEIVWYGADQDYGAKHSVFADFFGIKAATINATSRFTKMTKAKLVPMTHFRDLKTNQFHIRIHPEIEGFSEFDDLKAAETVNKFLENYLRGHPADYMWLHRRFKTRPEGEKPLYKPKTRLKMRRMIDKHYENILSESEILEGTRQRPLKIKMKSGNLLQFFYNPKWYKASPAKKFATQSGVSIKELYTHPKINAEIVRYTIEE
ncbi:MAG: LpxL/LpxP family Kdo(2)-lipid IV(A) lauroyl/palmitoleoyl acyltransferase [Enterobacterales bacterium]|nr:LpxL/LpxP family Kdo(2)-lipid IV(A) lauroyl/palmitoleoyl acyltransferase [Enterobacterales bacterium]